MAMNFMEEKMKNEGESLLVCYDDAKRSVEYESVHAKNEGKTFTQYEFLFNLLYY